jgi:excinuclease ABC subunit C
MAPRDWLAWAQTLPEEPGVYLYKDPAGEVVYVGKAKSLRARVRSYFQPSPTDDRPFIRSLRLELDDIETRVTRSEKEALILERELIAKYEPRHNVIWRDDKQYLCLRVDPSHDYPWVQVVRHMGRDGARYFGPFHSASAARQTLRVVNRYFQLRTCRDSVLYNRTRPCLEYQIGRCPAPCVFDVDREVYRQGVDDALMFLEGRGAALVGQLDARMWAAAEAQEYEVAARIRDQIRAIEKTLERQHAALPSLRDQDVVGLFRHEGELCIVVVEVRDGRVRDLSSHLHGGDSSDDGALLESFLLQFYAARAEVPAEVLVPLPLDGAAALGELLSEQRGKKVEVKRPVRGERVRLMELARTNAEHAYYEQRKRSGAARATLEGLMRRLHLGRLPRRIECYDISNLQGQEVVASGVAFLDGLPDRRRYRRYRVRSVQGQNDFASMYEVLSRRLSRGRDDGDLPDLIVIDGGKGQLASARAAMTDLGLEGPDLISLAKSRTEGEDEDGGLRRSPERVFLVGAKEPTVLKQSSAEVRLLAAIRDEAHRFAVTFHQRRRDKAVLRSELDDIPGIGPARRRALLVALGSVDAIRRASLETLAEVPGVGPAAAARVHAHFHGG